MRRRHGTGLLAGAIAGVVGGAVGTLAMDFVRYVASTASTPQAERQSFADWDLATSVDHFDPANSPAEVGRRAASSIGITLRPEQAQATTNVVHWSTGTSWAAAYGAVAARRIVDPAASVVGGALLGVTAWAASYVLLGAARIYQPIWNYEPSELAEDLRGHLVYGTTTGAATGLALAVMRQRR